MTWAFLYLAPLLVGLVLAAATGLARDVAAHALHHKVVTPRPDTTSALWTRIGRWLAATFSAFGFVGLLATGFRPASPWGPLASASAAGILAALLACLLVRPLCRPERRHGEATVVREIRPGSYGQVRLAGRNVVLAAQVDGDDVLSVGTAVEILDTDSSVVRVRRVGP